MKESIHLAIIALLLGLFYEDFGRVGLCVAFGLGVYIEKHYK